MSRRKDDAVRDRNNAAEIEHFLMYLGLYTRGFGCPDPMFFDGAVPGWQSMFLGICDSIGQSIHENDAAAELLPEIKGVAMLKGDDPNGYSLIGCRPMTFFAKQRLLQMGGDLLTDPIGQSMRHLLTPLTPILQVRRVEIDANGRGVASSPAYMVKPNKLGRWTEMRAGGDCGGLPLATMGWSLGLRISTVLRKTWSVNLKFDPESPGLCFITDPTGIREFFKFRDVPEGKARRDALANWVSDHWRELRNNPEDEVYVRTYLRGAREFSWRGLSGSIQIPDADIKKSEAAKEQRKRMSVAEAKRRRAKL